MTTDPRNRHISLESMTDEELTVLQEAVSGNCDEDCDSVSAGAAAVPVPGARQMPEPAG